MGKNCDGTESKVTYLLLLHHHCFLRCYIDYRFSDTVLREKMILVVTGLPKNKQTNKEKGKIKQLVKTKYIYTGLSESLYLGSVLNLSPVNLIVL